MISSELLGLYMRLCHLSQQMLESARQHAWDKLTEVANARTILVDELKQCDDIAWSLADGAKKAELIRAVQAADTEIKALTQSWMTELQGNLVNIGTGEKLNLAYQPLQAQVEHQFSADR